MVPRSSQAVAITIRLDNTKPSNGATRMKTRVLAIPLPMRTAGPVFNIAAPIMPPIRACDELEGIPNHQVMRLQEIAPLNAPKMTM